MSSKKRVALIGAGLLMLAGTRPPLAGPAAAAGPAASPAAARTEAKSFLGFYDALLLALISPLQDAQWTASIDVTPEHDGARVAAGKLFTAFTGNREVIARTKRLLAQRDRLEPIQVRQLEKILLSAAEAPGTIPDVVGRRIESESRQASIMDSFQFCLQRDGAACSKPTTTVEIDTVLKNSRDLDERLRIWQASKESGPALKPGIVALRDLRNAVAREMGHSSFFALQVADYGMTVPEMMTMLDAFVTDMEPLYKELHCWTRATLAQRYGQTVPKAIPAHWIGNRWAQNWPGIVEGVNLDPLFKDRTAEWIARQAEAFYVSMGFHKLSPQFWAESDLYPVPAGEKRDKNTHASAWDIDLQGRGRSLMNLVPDAESFATAHHELGHVYYYLSYDRPEVPPVLREGANRAFHEAIGELIGMASKQVPYLRQVGLLPEGQQIDQTGWLLNEALEEAAVPFVAFSAGTMSHWERDLYETNLPADQFNARWWQYVLRYQGVTPPAPRGEEFCDACTKTHINDDPAQYYDYAIATILKYQLHDHICRSILKQDPHACNYYGSAAVGSFLKGILEQGQTRDWRTLIKEATGSELSTRPMVAYFQPLVEYLKKENTGRERGWR